MQKIEAILQIKSGRAILSSATGRQLGTANLPEVRIGVCSMLDLELRSSTLSGGELKPYEIEPDEFDSFYVCMDGDWNHSTQPKLYSTAGIRFSRNSKGFVHLTAELPNTNTATLRAVLNQKESVILHTEICGYKSAEAVFVWNFDIRLCNRLFIEGDVPPEVSANPEYLTAAQVAAMIAEATRSTTPGPAGNSGAPGKNGTDGKSAYELAVTGGYTGTVAEWLAALKGADGKSAYELAVTGGYSGTAAQWLASLKGDKGDGLEFDAAGTVVGRTLYDAKPMGFRYAASVANAAANKTTIYIWSKLSTTSGDWSEPLTVDIFGAGAAPAAIVAPVSFAPYSDNEDHLYFQFSAAYEHATVSSVTISTSRGELTLPYASEFGVREIIRKANIFYVYFGAHVPSFTAGKIYLSQMLSVSGNTIETVPSEKMYYGTVSGLSKLSELTDLSGLTEADAGTLGKTSLGVVPAGSFAVVVVPSSGFAAYKDDGFGGKVAFSENNGAGGTGANGAAVTIGAVAYKVYGEFKLNNAEVFVYVDNQ